MRRLLWLASPVALLLFVGVISTAYQVISGNVICCRGDLGQPLGFYLVFVPTFCLVAIVKVIRWFTKRKR